MRTGALGALLLCVAAMAAGACSGSPTGLFRQYEYEEDVYLSLDGSATIYVNSSVLAFNALRGTSFDAAPAARIDDDVRREFETPLTHVTRVSRPSRRNDRRYLHVRLDARDIRRLGEAPPFAWSSYAFKQDGASYIYRQTVGPPATSTAPAEGGWTGDEIVAFRLHLPSRITYHNTPRGVQRGNILVWEQALRDRLRGVPIEVEVRMEAESILSSTLRLFGVAILAAAASFAFVVWWVMRRGRPRQA
jgi:hypothetical protein